MVPYPELHPKKSSSKRTTLELDELDELVLTISEEEEFELYNLSTEGSSLEESPKSSSIEERKIVPNIKSPIKILDWNTPDYVPQRRNCKVPCLHPLADGCGRFSIKQRLGPPVKNNQVKANIHTANITKFKSTQGKPVSNQKGGQSNQIEAVSSTNGQNLHHNVQTGSKKKKKKRKSKRKQQNGLYLIQSQIQDFTTDYW